VTAVAASRRELTAAAVVALAALIAFAPALAGVFVYDDIHSIAANPGVHSLANVPRFFVDPTLFSCNSGAMYRPVLLATFAFDWWRGGGGPLQFKLTNVLLHAAAAVLLLRLLRAGGVRPALAAWAAALFAVHPLASETVNLVSARSEQLLLVGALVALLGHGAALAGRRGGTVATLLGCALACGSKETGVVVPALLLVQEWLRGDPATAPWRAGRWRGVARRIGPALLLVVCYLGVRRLLLGMATANVFDRSAGDPLVGATRDLTTQLLTMGVLLPRACAQAIVPLGLSIDPPVPWQRTPWALWPWLGWAALAAATWLGVRRGRAQPLRTFGTALAWAIALPWIVIPLNVPLAEHRLYGVLAGLLCVAAAVAEAALARVASTPARWRRPALVAAGAVAAAFLLRSAWRCLDYRDEAAVWRAAIAVDDGSFRAHWGLGAALLQRGDAAGGAAALERACTLNPTFRAARASWIEAMLRLPSGDGWPARALAAATELVRQKDDDPYYRLLHARALLQMAAVTGDPATLRAAEARALSCHEVGERKATVYRLAAECRRRLGDPAGALQHLDDSIAAGLDQPALRAERSELLRALDRVAEADRDLRRAWQQAPLDPTVQAVWAHRTAAAPR